MRTAAIQMMPKFKDRAGNTTEAARLVEQAAASGAELIVLPELTTTGYSFMSADDALPCAEDFSDRASLSIRTFRTLARSHDVAIVVGLIEKDPHTQELYNSQVLILPNDSLASYRKISLFGNDFLWAIPGDSPPPIVRWRGKRIGLLICRDVRNRGGGELESFYEKGDADIVAFSANFGDGAFPSASWMKFSKDNDVSLVCANRYGRETCNNFGEGGVCIIEPPSNGRVHGVVHCDGLVWSAPCIVYGDV